MKLPNWIPTRFHTAFLSNSPSPEHPHYERLKALLQHSDMQHVWPVLEKNAKPQNELPAGWGHPLDAYLMAAQADLWAVGGLEIQETGQAAGKAEAVSNSLTDLHGKLKSLLREVHKKENSELAIQDLVRSAKALGVNTKGIEEAESEPNYLELLLKKLPELETFFESYSKAAEGLKQKVNKQSAPDRQALLLARALKSCTTQYFDKPLYPQIEKTIQVATGRPYDKGSLKKIKVKKNK